MRTANDELQDHLRRRAVASLEVAAAVVSAAALWTIAGRIQGASPEVQSVFLVVAMAFGAAFVRLLGKLVPLLAFRCPRCDGLFHADAERRVVRLRSCAHCRMTIERARPGEADASH